jgi:hypothetical protein
VATVATFELSTDVDAGVDEVFAVLSDLRNDPAWRREWVDARAETEGSARVGARTALVGHALGRRTETVYEVTDLEPGRTIEWRAVSSPLPLTFRRTVDEVGDRTRITFVYALEDSLPVRVLRPLLGWLGRRQLVGDLPTLRDLLESSPTSH